MLSYPFNTSSGVSEMSVWIPGRSPNKFILPGKWPPEPQAVGRAAVCVLAGFHPSWYSLEAGKGCRELRWKCSVISTQQSQGMVNVWIVVRTWAELRALQCLRFLEQQQPDLSATGEVSPWCSSWRQVQLSKQGVLITDKLILSLMDGDVCHVGMI